MGRVQKRPLAKFHGFLPTELNDKINEYHRLRKLTSPKERIQKYEMIVEVIEMGIATLELKISELLKFKK